jgi:hypothetical protein
MQDNIKEGARQQAFFVYVSKAHNFILLALPSLNMQAPYPQY